MYQDVTIIERIVSTILALCFFAIVTSIVINFVESNNGKSNFKEKKNVVDTFSMSAFFLIYYLIISFGIGRIELIKGTIFDITSILSAIVVIICTIINIKGRLSLGNNWADQIRIYKDHKFISAGIYKYIRHPLYASLIWIFYFLAVIFQNPIALILNSLVFLPFMYYRAKSEEKELISKFPEYLKYMKKVGMFFPNLFVNSKKDE